MEELGFDLVKELDDFLPQCDVVRAHPVAIMSTPADLGCTPLLGTVTAGRSQHRLSVPLITATAHCQQPNRPTCRHAGLAHG